MAYMAAHVVSSIKARKTAPRAYRGWKRRRSLDGCDEIFVNETAAMHRRRNWRRLYLARARILLTNHIFLRRRRDRPCEGSDGLAAACETIRPLMVGCSLFNSRRNASNRHFRVLIGWRFLFIPYLSTKMPRAQP